MTASGAGLSAAYAYDPLGRRTTKTVSGTVTSFLHDGDSEIADYDGGGNLLRRYVPGPAIDDYVAMVTAAGTATFFHTDKTGSIVAMSDASGNLVEGPYTYDAYGNCFSGGGACAAGVPLRYTGQRLDPETGLYYYLARYYSAALGRFLQIDPVGYKDDLNAYTYVGNDPTDLADPTGLIKAPGKCNTGSKSPGGGDVAGCNVAFDANSDGNGSVRGSGNSGSQVTHPVQRAFDPLGTNGAPSTAPDNSGIETVVVTADRSRTQPISDFVSPFQANNLNVGAVPS